MTRVPLLSVENLTVQFRGDRGWVTAIEDVSFEIGAGEISASWVSLAVARA